MANSSEELIDSEQEQNSLITHQVEEGGGACSKILTTKSSRLFSMLVLIAVYFMAEIIVGHITDSLTLIADSFHMLSDGLSLIVALTAVRMSKRKAHQSITAWPSKREYFNTFGWVRFEVVGALINSTFLLALCISILLEAIEKFYEPHLVNNPHLILAVGGGGLLINLFGLFMFGSHAHAGHDHSHGGHGHSHEGHNHSHVNSHQLEHKEEKKSHTHSEDHMNMRAVFLHVLGDALGSVIVMISATIILFVPHKMAMPVVLNETTTISSGTNTTTSVEINGWIKYIDPIMSIILVAIMVTTTVPLFKKSSLILLQTVPQNMNARALKEKMETIDGVQEVHDFHIWQLAGDKYVATVHIQCCDSQTYLRVAKEMKAKLHEEDIHSLTIQPEFKETPTRHCTMSCDTDECKNKVCCEIGTSVKKRMKSTSPTCDRKETVDQTLSVV